MDWTLPLVKILSTGILCLILTVICVLLVTRIQHALAVQNKREHTIKLSNQGNFASIFRLSVDIPERIFSFKFLLNGIPLVGVPLVGTSESPSVEPGIFQPVYPVQAGPEHTDGKAVQNANPVAGSGMAVATKAGQAASFLSILGSLLPGSLGSSLRSQSEALRRTQTQTQAVVKAPEVAKRKVEALQKQSGRLVGAAPSTGAGGQPHVSAPEAQPGPPAVPAPVAGSKPITPARAVSGIYTVHTQSIEPGGTLSLTLRVEASKRSRPAGTYAYTLSSQQLAAEALEGVEPPVTRQGILYFPPVEFWRYWLAPVTSFLVIAIFVLGLVFVVRFVWL